MLGIKLDLNNTSRTVQVHESVSIGKTSFSESGPLIYHHKVF